jgi:exonuclease III
VEAWLLRLQLDAHVSPGCFSRNWMLTCHVHLGPTPCKGEAVHGVRVAHEGLFASVLEAVAFSDPGPRPRPPCWARLTQLLPPVSQRGLADPVSSNQEVVPLSSQELAPPSIQEMLPPSIQEMAGLDCSELEGVNTRHGAEPVGLLQGVILTSPSSFKLRMSKLIPAPVISSQPHRHRAKVVQVALPRRSTRLVKKAMQDTPAVVTTQNVLMLKLGLSTGQQLQTANLDKYLKLFQEGLSLEQVQLIHDMFSGTVPVQGRLCCQGRFRPRAPRVVGRAHVLMAIENLLVWNVWGLNSVAHRNAVHDLISSESVSLVCLQETKMHVITDFDVLQTLGSSFHYVFLPTAQMRAGILLAWRSTAWVVSGHSARSYSLSTTIKAVAGGPEWWLTTVYGPAAEADKPGFLAELHKLCRIRSRPWMLIGDFNLIYRVEDKNNTRLNRCLMGQFRHFLNKAALQEVHLNGCLFTWSNKRAHPTLERIDQVFVSNAWDALYPGYERQSQASSCLGHAPLTM